MCVCRYVLYVCTSSRVFIYIYIYIYTSLYIYMHGVVSGLGCTPHIPEDQVEKLEDEIQTGMILRFKGMRAYMAGLSVFFGYPKCQGLCYDRD